MTRWVEQDAVLCGVRSAFGPPEDMMALPASNRGDLLLAHRAKAILLLPKMEEPSSSLELRCHVNVKPFFIVLFPLGIVGIGFPSNFHVSFDGRLYGVHQVAFLALCFSVEHPIVSVLGCKVLLHNPFVEFLGVSPFGPSPQRLVNGVIYRLEDFPAHDMLMILCPSSNDGVQLVDKFISRERGVLLDDVPQFFLMCLDVFLGRFDQQFPAFAVFVFTNILT